MCRRSGVSFSTVAFAALAMLVVGLLPGATAQRSSSGPVAVVDLAGVMGGLAERADAEARLRSRGESIRVEVETRQAKLRELQEAFAAMTDPTERLAAEEHLDAEIIQFMAWNELMKQELDGERALLLEKLYIDIMAAVKTMAESDGIDLVMVHDSMSEIQTNMSPDAPPLETQVRQQISMRRIAFAAPRIDRTRDVIIRMNNAYSPQNP